MVYWLQAAKSSVRAPPPYRSAPLSITIRDGRTALDQPNHANRLLFERETRELNRVAADVHQAAAADLLNIADILRIAIHVAEVHRHPAHLADLAGPDDLPHTEPLWMRPHHKR